MDAKKDTDISHLTRADFLKGCAATLAAGALAPLLPQMALAAGPMIKRKIPSSGELLPAVGLGTARAFGFPRNEADFKARKEVLRLLIESGASVVDTSPTYGRAEPVLGRALKELGLRDKTFIATKISIFGEQAGIAQRAQSVKDLHTPKFDLLQVHNLKDTKAHLRTIRKLKDQGQVRYAGITHFFSSAHGELASVLRSEKLDFVQFNYSLTDRRAERELLPLCKDLGIATMINVPFDRGNLFRRVHGQKLPAWAKEFDAETWGQFFLKFVLAHEAVTVAIPGTSKPKHIRDNLGAAFGKLPNAKHKKQMISLIENL